MSPTDFQMGHLPVGAACTHRYLGLDDVAAACGISAMPTFQLYSNGVMVKEMCGADRAKLEALANEANDL